MFLVLLQKHFAEALLIAVGVHIYAMPSISIRYLVSKIEAVLRLYDFLSVRWFHQVELENLGSINGNILNQKMDMLTRAALAVKQPVYPNSKANKRQPYIGNRTLTETMPCLERCKSNKVGDIFYLRLLIVFITLFCNIWG